MRHDEAAKWLRKQTRDAAASSRDAAPGKHSLSKPFLLREKAIIAAQQLGCASGPETLGGQRRCSIRTDTGTATQRRGGWQHGDAGDSSTDAGDSNRDAGTATQRRRDAAEQLRRQQRQQKTMQ